MTYETRGHAALDYFPCRYGNSKFLFRGPRRKLQDAYVAYLGGIETYGKFISTPFPMLTEVDSGLKSVNLGCVNAGIDAYASDKNLLNICTQAKATVIEVMGAQNMSNRFYAVHPRRNDRFLHASTLLKTIYGEIDFTEFSFTRHMLGELQRVSPEKFAMVRQELKEAWVARMRVLIKQIAGPVVLLWLGTNEPPEPDDQAEIEPLYVDREMLERLRSRTAGIVTITADPEERAAGLDEMFYSDMEAPTAQEMLGPVVHRRAAAELVEVLGNIR